MKSHLLLLPLLALCLFACKKDDSTRNTVTPGTGYRTLEEALVSGSAKMKTTGLIIASGDTLYGPGGTRIMIPPNAFETQSGARATGSVNISYMDWNLKGDMVFGHVLPLSLGDPLMAVGQAYLSAVQNGQPLRVNRDTEIVFQFHQGGIAPGSDLHGWSGRTLISATSIVNWVDMGTDGKLRPAIVADSVNLIADTLGYVAASSKMSVSNRVNFNIRVNSPAPLESSLSVVLYTGARAVYPLPSVSNGQITATAIPSAPFHLAVMGINKGVFYGGTLEVAAPLADSTYEIKLQSTDPAFFRLTMNAL